MVTSSKSKTGCWHTRCLAGGTAEPRRVATVEPTLRLFLTRTPSTLFVCVRVQGILLTMASGDRLVHAAGQVGATPVYTQRPCHVAAIRNRGCLYVRVHAAPTIV